MSSLHSATSFKESWLPMIIWYMKSCITLPTCTDTENNNKIQYCYNGNLVKLKLGFEPSNSENTESKPLQITKTKRKQKTYKRQIYIARLSELPQVVLKRWFKYKKIWCQNYPTCASQILDREKPRYTWPSQEILGHKHSTSLNNSFHSPLDTVINNKWTRLCTMKLKVRVW